MATLAERKAEYEQYQIDGTDLYNTIRSQLTLDIESGLITLTDAISIQSQMHEVGSNLLTGDFKSAYQSCIALNVNSTLTQARLDSIKTEIGNYITANYTW